MVWSHFSDQGKLEPLTAWNLLGECLCYNEHQARSTTDDARIIILIMQILYIYKNLYLILIASKITFK